MHLCLFEDRADRLEPLSLTRPVFDLLCGITTLASKQFRHVADAAGCGAWVRPALEEVTRLAHPGLAVNDLRWLLADDVILVNGRWLPPAGTLALPGESCVGMVEDQVAYAVLRREDVQALTGDNLPELLVTWARTLPARPAGGKLIHYPWDLVEQNGPQLCRDFADLGFAQRPGTPTAPLAVVGPAAHVWVDPTARVEPMVVADTTRGPVVIDHGAVIAAFTRLEGPCYVGPRTQVFGAKIRAGTTLGPQCRIGGEVEASIVHGHANKYHDGFLGHSYVGEWVNLGAGTHNSDLRNDYGEVTVIVGGRPVRSGQSKVGCFLGDHVKTGLGTLLNTGTNVGPFCNLLPVGRYAPKYVPAYTSWWNGALREAFTPDHLLATAELAMQRRGIALTDAQKALYASVYEETAPERSRVLGETDRRLRLSA